MQNTKDFLLRLMLTIFLSCSFPLLSHADAADAIGRQQQAPQAAGPKQAEAAGAAQSGVKSASVPIAAKEPVQDSYSVGQLFLGLIGWSFALFVMVYIYGRLAGVLDSKAGNILTSISLISSCAASALVIINKFPTHPMNALSGLLGWWIAQCGFIYIFQRRDKKRK